MTHSISPAKEFANWADLEAELDQWASGNAVATFWWRDDDAATWTDALARLLVLAGETPLALAVIPAEAEPALARGLASFPQASVLQHGWAHRNHAAGGRKKTEFGADRPLDQRRLELAQGHARIHDIFSAQALPVLVPPWNRIAPDLLPHLAAIGFSGLSTMNPRPSAFAAPGVRMINTHVDLIDWGAGRGFVGAGPALALVLRHLRQRRMRQVDDAEPTGILTHHLVQDDAANGFLARLLRLVASHSATRFVAAPQIFGVS
jgi:hypothetical protein